MPGFDPKSGHVRFVVNKVALGQVFLRVVTPVSLLSVLFHQCSTLIFIYMLVLPEGQNGRSLVTF